MSSRHARHRAGGTPLTRRLALAGGALAAVVASIAVTGSSSASFTASSSSTSSVSSAADWTPPTVSVTAPAATVSGTVKITAVATDDVTGVASVTLQRASAGGTTWSNLCEPIRKSPYACDWNTTSLTDGSYDLRAIAVDAAGNSRTSAIVSTKVSNRLTVSLDRPGDFVRGTVSTAVALSNVGTQQVSSVAVQFAPTGTTGWTTVCTTTVKPYTCSVDTKLAANGTYDLRAVAVVGGVNYTSPVVSRVVVDNQAPTVTMTDPGSPLKGTKSFAATASDPHSGIAKIVVEAGTGGTWTEICSATSAPLACSYDTSKLPNGSYSFRAVATDRAGNSATSSEVTRREVSNVVTAVTLTASRTVVNASATVKVAATSNTIASVKVQRSVAGAGAWKEVCSSASASFDCSFDTRPLDDGMYDLRAIVTDADGRTATSAILTLRVDNTPPGKGVDIQTTNGGTAGRVDAGDTIVFTFSKQMDLSTIYSGWSGAAQSGTAKFRNTGLFNGDDIFELSAPDGADLGSVALNEDYTVLGFSTSMTMTAETVTVDETAHTVVTVRITSSPTSWAGTPKAAAMVWTPSSSITDLAGNAISTAKVTESGPLDVDF